MFSALLFICMQKPDNHWLIEKQRNFNLIYKPVDKNNIREYNELIQNGITTVFEFFNDSYRKAFNVFIHPGRPSLDSTWQKDWNMPEFRSECWMVASGIATRLDMISPKQWKTEACEHRYAESEKTQQLITHELVHVYHGQLNLSPDFSNVEGIDWFVEGLATYASGQCDSSRISEVKKAINNNIIPESLENCWTGKIKYGLSGTIVMYIDHKFGREKLKDLLPLNKKSEILSALGSTETDLLDGWKKYIQNL